MIYFGIILTSNYLIGINNFKPSIYKKCEEIKAVEHSFKMVSKHSFERQFKSLLYNLIEI